MIRDYRTPRSRRPGALLVLAAEIMTEQVTPNTERATAVAPCSFKRHIVFSVEPVSVVGPSPSVVGLAEGRIPGMRFRAWRGGGAPRGFWARSPAGLVILGNGSRCLGLTLTQRCRSRHALWICAKHRKCVTLRECDELAERRPLEGVGARAAGSAA